MQLTSHRQQIFLDRYALKDEGGQPLEDAPFQMWDRVARAVASVEDSAEQRFRWHAIFQALLWNFKFVPAGRILAGAGTGHHVTMMNCFVLPSPEDSRGGIMDNLKLMIEIMARGGGVGVNLSSLRPRGSYIKTVNGHSSGPVSWAELYSVATGDVIQQGGSRRGALMLMLDDSHPDILEFINRKSRFITDADGRVRPEFLQYANISVAISNEFMEAVEHESGWELAFNGNVLGRVSALELFHAICEHAWTSADPGVVFMGRCRDLANSWYFEDINCVNPCSEQPLGPYSVCNLGSMNVAAYANESGFHWTDFNHDVRNAVRFMDNVIDLSAYPLAQSQKIQQNDIRRCGLGLMGLADALIKMKIRYGSPEAVAFTKDVYCALTHESYEASSDLAQERGSFGQLNRDKFLVGCFTRRLDSHVRQKIGKQGIRNCFLTTQAPTGTTSLLAGVSSGIEPNFDFVTRRRDRTGEHILRHPLYQEWLDSEWIGGLTEPSYFVKAEDVSVGEHIAMQAAAQEWLDSAISKTINLPRTATVKDVEDAYMQAWFKGCKGVTVYRDGSRDAVLTHASTCQECGGLLVQEEGCTKCLSCGYSACEIKR